MRRLLTFAGLSIGTAVAALWWLYEGELWPALQPAASEVGQVARVVGEAALSAADEAADAAAEELSQRASGRP